MKEKKMGNVRDWGLNKDICGASRELICECGIEGVATGKSGSQGLNLSALVDAGGSALTKHR